MYSYLPWFYASLHQSACFCVYQLERVDVVFACVFCTFTLRQNIYLLGSKPFSTSALPLRCKGLLTGANIGIILRKVFYFYIRWS